MGIYMLVFALCVVIALAVFLVYLIDYKFKRLNDSMMNHDRANRFETNQIEHLLALYHDLKLDGALPATRDWAGSPDFLRIVYEHVRALKPETVVECGSGVSSIVIARALQQNGKGRLISLDHDAIFAEKTRQNLAHHGLEQWVDMRVEPLQDSGVAGQKTHWYPLKNIPSANINMVVVDGPPITNDAEARFCAGPTFIPKMSDQSVMLLDDFNRAGDSSIVEKWRAAFPSLGFEKLATEKGCCRLTVNAK
jgi:Methyltransferase domain